MWHQLFPEAVRGRAYPTALFVAAVLTTVVAASYAIVFAFLSPGGATRIVVVDVALAVASAIAAVLVARGRISSLRALDFAAGCVLGLAFAALLNELVALPARAGPITAHCCLVSLCLAVVVRRKATFLVLLLTAPLAWGVTVASLDAGAFDSMLWLPTWAFTVAVAGAVFTLLAAEWQTANSRLARTEQLATTDVLTGLVNRRGFTALAQQLTALAHRRHDHLWCAFLDVEGFKALNDSHGHPAGDQVLIATAQALDQVARDADVVARWGGDEFVILGLGAAPDPTRLETRIVVALTAKVIHLELGWAPGVTVGVAVDAGLGGPESVAVLVAQADAHMYRRRASRS